MTMTARGHRDAPHRTEHDLRERDLQRPRPMPQTWEALSRWFREAWEASLPTRLHTLSPEPDDVLGGPRWAAAFRRRITSVSERGWGVSGWDRDGWPRGVDRDTGTTDDPFLFALERMLRAGDTDAAALCRWAYMGWDVAATAHAMFLRTHGEDDYAADALRALLERGIRRLWWSTRREPVRFSVCRTCRQRECRCDR